MPTTTCRIITRMLPITVAYEWDDGDSATGIDPGVESWDIVGIGQRRHKTAPQWLLDVLTDRDEDIILQACATHVKQCRDEAAIDRYTMELAFED